MDVIGILNDLTGDNLLFWKVIATTVVLCLAGLQVAMAAGFYQVAVVPGVSPSAATRIHRASGRITLTLAILVAFACLVGPAGPLSPARVLLHSIFGTLLFALLTVKFTIIRLVGRGDRLLPFVGGALFLTFAAIWATSVADYVASR